jgi:hypothetical protein
MGTIQNLNYLIVDLKHETYFLSRHKNTKNYRLNAFFIYEIHIFLQLNSFKAILLITTKALKRQNHHSAFSILMIYLCSVVD